MPGPIHQARPRGRRPWPQRSAGLSAARTTLASFQSVFTAAQTGWSSRWQAAFTPGNTHFSGSLPVITTDRPAIDRLYYMSVLSVLAAERTNLGPSFSGFLGRPAGGFRGFDRIYTTGANEFGGTTMFFWDTSYASALLALLDPAMLKAITSYFLTVDIHSCYGIDTLTGNRVGNYYSANDLTVSSTALNYVKLTGDWAYLSSTVGSNSVLQLLTTAATYWRNFVANGQRLADYGANINLLEVLPRYTNQVASLNAGNVWLMRQVADLQTRSDNPGQAGALTTSANSLLPNVLALYVPGEGVWNCRHPDGTLVPIRTVVSPGWHHAAATYDGSTMRIYVDGVLRASKAQTGTIVPSNVDLMVGNCPSDPTRQFRGTIAGAQVYNRALPATEISAAYAAGNPFAADEPALVLHVPMQLGLPGLIPDRPALNPTTTVTLAAWVSASSWPANIWEGSIIAKDSFAANAGYALRGGAGGLLSFFIYTGGGNWSELTTTTPLPAGWHHVAATFNGSTMNIYVDGVQRASKAQSGSIAPSSIGAMIGNCPSDLLRQFAGSIADARIYARALSAAEISALHAAGNTFAARAESSLKLWYPPVAGPSAAVPDVGLIANDDPQVYNGTEGGAFAGVIIADLFGYTPDGQQVGLSDAGIARGIDGTLSGLSFKGGSYTITSGPNGLTIA
jgi:hypothetical protein